MAAAGGAPFTVTALLLGGRRGPAPPLSGARCGPAPAPGCLPRAMGEQWGGEWSRAPPRRGGRGRSARWPPRPCPLVVCRRPELHRGREEVGRPAREGPHPPLPPEGAGRVQRGGAARRRREQGWGGAAGRLAGGGGEGSRRGGASRKREDRVSFLGLGKIYKGKNGTRKIGRCSLTFLHSFFTGQCTKSNGNGIEGFNVKFQWQ